MAAGIGYGTDKAEEELLEYVRTHAGANDVYLLPVSVPDVGKGPLMNNRRPLRLRRDRKRGRTSFPSTFSVSGSSPAADLHRFQIGLLSRHGGHRVAPSDASMRGVVRRQLECTGPGSGLRDANITHIVTPASRPIEVDWLRKLHSDGSYILYRVE